MMHRLLTGIVFLCASAAMPSHGFDPDSSRLPSAAENATGDAGAADAFSRCLIEKVDDGDRRLLVRWGIAAFSKHPDIQDLLTVDEAKFESLTRDAAGLFLSLLTERCVVEFRAAARTMGGRQAVSRAFENLGQTAFGGMVSHPAVVEAISQISRYADDGRVERALKGD